MTFDARHISVSIDCPPNRAYDFASNPENLPEWAAGLGDSVENVDGDWIAESPMGRVTVEFVDTNQYGVLDHNVTLPSGETVYNPVRVFPNEDGSELIFTLYRRRNVSDPEFEDDAQTVKNDLDTLKTLLEDEMSQNTR